MATISSWSLSCSTSVSLRSNVSFSSCSFLHSLWAWLAWPLTVSRYSCNPLMTPSKSFFRASFAAIWPKTKKKGGGEGNSVYKKMLSRYINTAFRLLSYLLPAKSESLSFQLFPTTLFFFSRYDSFPHIIPSIGVLSRYMIKKKKVYSVNIAYKMLNSCCKKFKVVISK